MRMSSPQGAAVSGVIGRIREPAFALNFFPFVSGAEDRVDVLEAVVNFHLEAVLKRRKMNI